ncbi:hypothetical protein Tco_1033890, partial [Tanacetum coccineum]
MYKEYLAEFWYSAKALENSKVSFSIPTGGIYGEVRVNTFRNVIGAHYLLHSSKYVAPPSIDIVRIWFETIGYGEIVPAKWTLKKSLLPPNRKATKGGSSKAPTGSKTGHLKRKKDSSSTMESNPSQTSASTPMVTEMHKEDQQATGGPNSLGVTSEESADPQLSSENSTAEVDPGKSAPSDFIPQQQGLETVLTQSIIDKGANNIAKQIEEVEASRIIKLEDQAKLMQNVQPSFKDLESPKDDPIIVVDDSNEDEEAEKDGLHATLNIETEDASFPKSSSLRSSQIQELTNQVLIIQSQKH